jgi:hypothetical protein
MSTLRKMWQVIRENVRQAWYDPMGLYSEHGREGL